MTVAEAHDALHCWRLIERCQKVGMPVPQKWMRHGLPPSDPMEYWRVLAVTFDTEIFRPSPLLTYFRSR